MRSLSDYVTLILLLAYWIFTLGAWWSIHRYARELTLTKRTVLTTLYWAWALVQSVLLILLYMNPPPALEGRNYSFYFCFNGFLMTDMLAKFPLVACSFLLLFTGNERRKRIISTMGAILSTGIFLVLFTGFTLGLQLFEKKEVTLHFDSLPAGFDGYRIVQLADIHLGSFHSERMVHRMAAVSRTFRPDIVVFTGDLVNNHAWEAEGLEVLLGQFQAKEGRYAILGNHDYGDYYRWPSATAKAQNFREIIAEFHDAGYRLLRNEPVILRQSADSIYLIGVENWGHVPFPRYTDLKKAVKGIPNEAFRILLTHDPGHWEAEVAADHRYPLTLAGHTHGLQWGVKWAGIQFSAVSLLIKHWGGLYGKEGRFLYVNRGMGIIGMPFRIDMPPEITLITLRKN